MGKPKSTKEVKELIDMMDSHVEQISGFVDSKKPLWKGGNLICAIESADYEVKITVEKKSKSNGVK